jgi:hypothetical protein
MHQFFAPAEPTLEQPDRPSQMVQEITVSTPRGQHVQVSLERISTGGTRHQAQFERASTGPMSGAERMKKQRARCSLFPETQASARENDAERVAARRAAAGERMDVDEEAEEREPAGLVNCGVDGAHVADETCERDLERAPSAGGVPAGCGCRASMP